MTPWLQGRSPTEAEAREPRHVSEVVLALVALHRAAPPDGLRSWTPQVGPAFAEELRARTAKPWASGPLAEQARFALAAHDDAIRCWTGRYLELAEMAFSRRDSWVPTHGEPHNDNQIMTAHGLRLVDWESLTLAHLGLVVLAAGQGAIAVPCLDAVAVGVQPDRPEVRGAVPLTTSPTARTLSYIVGAALSGLTSSGWRMRSGG